MNKITPETFEQAKKQLEDILSNPLIPASVELYAEKLGIVPQGVRYRLKRFGLYQTYKAKSGHGRVATTSDRDLQDCLRRIRAVDSEHLTADELFTLSKYPNKRSSFQPFLLAHNISYRKTTKKRNKSDKEQAKRATPKFVRQLLEIGKRTSSKPFSEALTEDLNISDSNLLYLAFNSMLLDK